MVNDMPSPNYVQSDDNNSGFYIPAEAANSFEHLGKTVADLHHAHPDAVFLKHRGIL